ncbi:MAG: hypothetical protein PQJ58_08270 [Spirochaetales bacterium]|nr:hypothetical protein [Spirochaetales bacterium]
MSTLDNPDRYVPYKVHMVIAIVLGVVSLILTLFRLPWNGTAALAAYILGSYVALKADGTLIGLLKVILVIPAIIVELQDGGGSDEGDLGPNGTDSIPYDRLQTASLVVPGLALMGLVIIPVARRILDFFRGPAF